jgi:hypothetical protein
MLPLVVRTLPESGATGVALATPLQLGLALPIDWDRLRLSQFELLSLTANTAVVLTALTHDPVNFTITLATAGLAALNRYRLTASGLYDVNGVVYAEAYSFEFETTVAATALPAEAPFGQVFSYPWSGANNVAPAAVRLRFNRVLDKAAMNLDLTDPACAVRVIPTVAYRTGELFSIDGTLDPAGLARTTDLVFQPTAPFAAGTEFTVLLQGVKAADEGGVTGTTLPDAFFVFTTRYANSYCSLTDLTDIAPFLAPEIENLGNSWFYRKLSLIGDSLVARLLADDVTYTASNVYFLDYIKCACVCEVLLARITDIATSSTSKTLADFQVTYTRSVDDLKSLLRLWEDRRDADYLKLSGVSGAVTGAAFVRGSSADTAYDYMDRGMKSFDATTKSW